MAVIKRYLSESVFLEFKNDLAELYSLIRKENINKDAEFWDMQFRKDDTISLYYKGCAFNFKLAVNEGKANYKLNVSKALEQHLERFLGRNLFDEINNKTINIQTKSLRAFFLEYICKFQAAVKDSVTKKERETQQYLTALLEKNNHCFIIDYEIAIEGEIEEQCKVLFNKQCNTLPHEESKRYDEGKSYRELDLLVLRKNSNEKYELVPVEVKMENNRAYKEALCQINAYTFMVKKNIGDFIDCYEKVIKQKSEVGILDSNFKDFDISKIETSINKSLAVVIYDNSISSKAQKISKMKEILKNCENLCGYKDQTVEAVAIALEKDNHKLNREKIHTVIMHDIQ